MHWGKISSTGNREERIVQNETLKIDKNKLYICAFLTCGPAPHVTPQNCQNDSLGGVANHDPLGYQNGRGGPKIRPPYWSDKNVRAIRKHKEAFSKNLESVMFCACIPQKRGKLGHRSERWLSVKNVQKSITHFWVIGFRGKIRETTVPTCGNEHKTV